MSRQNEAPVWDGKTCVSCEKRPVRELGDDDPLTWMEAVGLGNRPAYCQECFDEFPEDVGDV